MKNERLVGTTFTWFHGSAFLTTDTDNCKKRLIGFVLSPTQLNKLCYYGVQAFCPEEGGVKGKCSVIICFFMPNWFLVIEEKGSLFEKILIFDQLP